MKICRRVVLAGAIATTTTTTGSVSAADTEEEQRVRSIIEPWYSLFTVPERGSVRAVFDQVIAHDFINYRGELASEISDREATFPIIEALAGMVPDMRFEIRELLIAGDKAVVRGRAIGTPAGELFGQPHTGRSFQIMTIDILTLRAGQITRIYHLENWLSAFQQLRG
jgi:predicted ester cyclase